MTVNPNALDLRSDDLARYKSLVGQPTGEREIDKLSLVDMGVETRAANERRMYGGETDRRWYRPKLEI